MRVGTGFSVNTVLWITSLSDDEVGPSRRMAEEMHDLAQRNDFVFQWLGANRRSDLVALLEDVERNVYEGMKPIIVLDMHGDADGLCLAQDGESLSWMELGKLLGAINIAMKNNLCVIGAACFSLKAIAPTKLSEPAPFLVLLAPEKEVTVGFLEDRVPKFFEHLYTHGDVDEAYAQHLAEKLKYFHCEKMLFIVIANYVKTACKGRSAAERRERLLTEVFEQGVPNTEANRSAIRKQIKEGIRPGQALLDRYAESFLIGRSCSFTIDELLDFIDKEQT